MDDKALRRMAEESFRRGCRDVCMDCAMEFARRVATEAARLERERIGRIMHDWLDVPLDAYERRIKGGE